jgi:DNA-binding transcriptional LysR family regulator
MELHQLRCFVVAADELHFGRAAQRLQMMPSAFGRHIKLLEEFLGAQLFTRTTRAVALTEDGATLLGDVRLLLEKADAIEQAFRNKPNVARRRRFRIGAVDSAAAGLIPQLLTDVHEKHPEISIQLMEDKTIRLLPKLLSGALDLAFVRPPLILDKRIEFAPLLYETAVVACAQKHPLARRRSLSLRDIADQPLIVPDRRSRPQSHDLTVKLFEEAALKPKIAEVADEKQTIINLVAAGLGLAIVPRWTSRMAITGVRFVPLNMAGLKQQHGLPLAAAWVRGSRDPTREAVLDVLRGNLSHYSMSA